MMPSPACRQICLDAAVRDVLGMHRMRKLKRMGDDGIIRWFYNSVTAKEVVADVRKRFHGLLKAVSP